MEIESKSFELFIKELVRRFTYEDFQPPFEKPAISKRFKEIVCAETAFWKPIDLGPRLEENWSSIKFKSFKDWDPVIACFSFTKRVIRIGLLEDYGRIGNIQEIPLTSVWVDHGKLTGVLSHYLIKCLNFANREKYEDTLDSGTATQ